MANDTESQLGNETPTPETDGNNEDPPTNGKAARTGFPDDEPFFVEMEVIDLGLGTILQIKKRRKP